LMVLWLGTAAVEARQQFQPNLDASPVRRLYVIGDSISAGLKSNDPNVWSKLFAAQHNVEIVDLSRAGATTAVALKRTMDTALDDGVVLLEIGGNDLLGSTPTVEFARNLDSLLGLVCDPGRQVVMFELPLPPLGNEYGRVQRQLAAKHGVQLIPRRTLMGILGANGATVDSLHLTRTGHQRMADAVWQILQSAYPVE
jgi:acyl-CoA thioesterase-1